MAGVGELVVSTSPRSLSIVDLLVHPRGIDRPVVGDRVGVAEIDALVGLDEQPRGADRQVDAGRLDGALDERARALAADQAGELARSARAASRRCHGVANASPTPAVSTVWRSGRSSISHESRKATARIAAATRKTVESESLKAPV